MVRSTLRWIGVWATSMGVTLAMFVFFGMLLKYDIHGFKEAMHIQIYSHCDVAPHLIAIRPAFENQWTVLNVETEQTFRSKELCTAVQEAQRTVRRR